jgi:hypothetical protein
MNDTEYIARNECPVCRNGPRGGTVNPRRALQEHLRSCKRPDHTLWKTEHYAKHFKYGGNHKEVAIDKEYIIKAVACTFGEEWANRVSVQS